MAAARAGADAVGLVFYLSAPRHVSIERAKEILNSLPPFVTPVGLFVDAEAAAIRQTATELRLGHVQLHGQEPPALVAELQGLSVIKAVRVDRNRLGDELHDWRQAIERLNLIHLHGLVLETAGTNQPGGTGVVNDWETIEHAMRIGQFEGLPPIIAAGGLTPENVGGVVRKLRPWAVDVSSGVEIARGEKSEEKIRAFVQAVRDADQANAGL